MLTNPVEVPIVPRNVAVRSVSNIQTSSPMTAYIRPLKENSCRNTLVLSSTTCSNTKPGVPERACGFFPLGSRITYQLTLSSELNKGVRSLSYAPTALKLAHIIPPWLESPILQVIVLG